MMKRFFEANRGICRWLMPHLPQAKTNIFHLYEDIVSRYMNERPNQVVVDIGAGRVCPFARRKDPLGNVKIIAVDVSREALGDNTDVDEKIVVDTMQALPFEDETVDLVVSRSVLEHLEDPESLVIHAHRVLKKNGHCIHLFPSKFAFFALINQMLPRKLSKKMLYFLFPESKGISGFPAFYNKCYYSAIRSLLENNGFEILEIYVTYSQSGYFGFFVPLFLISSLCEMLLNFLRIKNFGAYVLVIARKK